MTDEPSPETFTIIKGAVRRDWLTFRTAKPARNCRNRNTIPLVVITIALSVFQPLVFNRDGAIPGQRLGVRNSQSQVRMAKGPVLAMYSTSGFINSTRNTLQSLSESDYCKLHDIHLWALDSATSDAFRGIPKVTLRSPLLSNMSNLADYGTNDFKLLTLHKPLMLHRLLLEVTELGLPILYMDSDIVVQAPIVEFLNHYEKESDILFQYNGENCNTGFIYIRATRAAERFIKHWKELYQRHVRAIPERPGNDQTVLNEILNGSLNWQGTKISYLPTYTFPNGEKYFNEEVNRDQVKVIHNNCIIGLSSKVKRLKRYGLWKPVFRGHRCEMRQPV